MIFTNTVFNTLEATLEDVSLDEQKDIYSGSVWSKWLEQGKLSKNFEDYLGIAGMGLLDEMPEGTELPSGDIKEDYLTRWYAKGYGKKIAITEEAMDDVQYSKVIDLGKHLNRAAGKTLEIETTRLLTRMFNTSYPGGDGLPLASASHTLPDGGTYSNVLGTPAAPSESVLNSIRAQVAQMPGRDGLTDGWTLKKVIYPTLQHMIWRQLTGSQYTPEANNFAKINTVKDMSLGLVENPFWQNTETQYAFTTSAGDGPEIKFRKKFKSMSWRENSHLIMYHAIHARWVTYWTNPRGFFAVQAT